MNTASNDSSLKLPPDMSGVFSSVTVGMHKKFADGHAEALPPEKLHAAGSDTRTVLVGASTAAGVSMDDAMNGVKLLDDTTKNGPHPASTLGANLNGMGAQAHGGDVRKASVQPSLPDVTSPTPGGRGTPT